MRNLLVLYTGGTIGMTPGPDGLRPEPGLLPRQLERLASDSYRLTVREYQPLIDSSALTPASWNRLIDDIAADYANYDGFVVIHGTDTLAYTASVLAFALRNLAKPVVITGSQLPLSDPLSDGWSNLAEAFAAACQPALHEVCVLFQHKLWRGSRVRKLDAEGFAAFAAPNHAPLAEFASHPNWYRERWLRATGAFAPQRINEALRLALLPLSPGYAATLFGELLGEGRLDGAVLLSYGVGNAPDEAALLEGVRRFTAAGGVVLNLSQVPVGTVLPGQYAASQPLIAAGALPGRDLTPEAALAKLQVLLSQGLEGDALRAALEQVRVGEMSSFDA